MTEGTVHSGEISNNISDGFPIAEGGSQEVCPNCGRPLLGHQLVTNDCEDDGLCVRCDDGCVTEIR